MNFHFMPTLSWIFQQVLPSNTCVFLDWRNMSTQHSMPHGTELLSYLTKTSQWSFQRLLEPHKPSEFQRVVWSEASTPYTFRMDFATCRVRTEWQPLFPEQSICFGVYITDFPSLNALNIILLKTDCWLCTTRCCWYLVGPPEWV